MAEPDNEQLGEWERWLSTCPDDVAIVARRLPTWKLYRIKSTGQHCVITSYQEADPDGHPMFSDVTLNVVAWREWMPLPLGVFGVKPDDLEVIENP